MRHLAHFLHLHDLAEVGQQALVLGVDEAPGPDLEGEIGTLEAITLDAVCRALYLSVTLCRADPKLAEESQGTVSSTRIYSTLYVVNTICRKKSPRGWSARLYVDTFSQHYMLTLFLQKIARHYMLII